MGEISLVRGIGVDIVKLERIEAAYERFGERFARRVLSADELATNAITASFIAKRFAAKEAIAKAFIVSSKLCFSKAFQLIIKPLFSNNDLRSLKINSKSENFISSFLFSKSS